MSEKQTAARMSPQEAAKTMYKIFNGAGSIRKEDYPRLVNALLYASNATTGEGKPVNASFPQLKYGLFDYNFGFMIGRTQYLMLISPRSTCVYLTLINANLDVFIDKEIMSSGIVRTDVEEIDDDVDGDYDRFPRLRPLVRKLIALIQVLGDPTTKGGKARSYDEEDERAVSNRPIRRMTAEMPVITNAVASRFIAGPES